MPVLTCITSLRRGKCEPATRPSREQNSPHDELTNVLVGNPQTGELHRPTVPRRAHPEPDAVARRRKRWFREP